MPVGVAVAEGSARGFALSFH
ncbi:protein of unknown function [Cupriavidus taiwanensis]|nr:protein of unknown function [Cupriavidus taiwanensis]